MEHMHLPGYLTRYIKITLFISLLTAGISSNAQVIYENPKHQIYEFLSRQAQKGNIDLADFIQPISRKEIAGKLNELQDSIEKLSPIEQKELAFYQKEFSEFNSPQKDSSTFLKKDPTGRLRFLSVKKGDFILRGDPSILLGVKSGSQGTSSINGGGLQFWGHAGKQLSFQAGYIDITEYGEGLDRKRAFTAEPGIVPTEGKNPKQLNYADFRGNITYSWHNGAVSLGNDQLLYGYGENGRIIQSDKAPAYPFIRLDYQPLKWLRFNYSHAWLQSGLIDSSRSYNKGNDIFGPYRESWISKFMASHSLNFFPIKGLALSVGESMVYSDRLDIGYLLPFMFFKIYDQYASRYKITSGSNGQFFFQASSRNHLRNTHLYATLFIDEIRMAEIFNAAKSRNQIGFNIGASVTDPGIPYLTLGAEYARINPFVYQNLIPAQYYTHQTYTLGDWMGANADRLMGYIKYTPIPRLKAMAQIQYVRKGDPGSLLNQYFAEPQPAFLSNLQKEQTQYQLKLSYEWLNNLYLDGIANWTQEKNVINQTTSRPKYVQLQVRIGI